MKKFLKKFPLTAYASIILLIAFNLDRDVQYDSGRPVVLIILLIVFLALPLLAISQIYTFLNIEISLYWVIPICFLLDLLLLSLRTGSLKNLLKKTYHKLTKPKK